MTSEMHGRNILGSEVAAVGRDGFWIITHDREYFIPFNSYPVFRKATVQEIFAMEEIAPGQFRWEPLDADIELGALAYPERFPLTFLISAELQL